MSTTGPTRTLILIRHAKAEPPAPGQADGDRALTSRGQLDAVTAGRELSRIAVPGVVLCSSARRTRQTWRAVLEGLTAELGTAPHPEAHYLTGLYEAGVLDVIETVRKSADDHEVVVVVGHEPVMSEAVLALAGDGSDEEAVKHVRSGFPTGGIAVLAVDREWADLAPGDGRLERFVVPRAEGGGSIR